MCQELKLIIEIDGTSHDTERDQEKDRQRDQSLSLAGYRVMRILNEDVLQRLAEVSARIEEIIEEIEESTPGHAGPRGHPRRRGTACANDRHTFDRQKPRSPRRSIPDRKPADKMPPEQKKL
jgi:hypothetical protein